MTERTTISMSPETREKMRELKPYESMSPEGFINVMMENWQRREEHIGSIVTELEQSAEDTNINSEALARDVARRIDYAALASKTAVELEGRMR